MLIHECREIPVQKSRAFETFKKMDVIQRSVIFYDRRKGYGYKKIHTKMRATDRQEAGSADYMNYWAVNSTRSSRLVQVREATSDISEAISILLTEQPFRSAKPFAA
jgi:hypothetical protein